MPTRKTAHAPRVETAAIDVGSVEVRALVDNHTHGFTAGRLAVLPAEMVAPLRAAHMVDDHPDAVAYAKSLEADK